MTKNTEQDESIRIAHLSMIQGVIARMGANCFTLKLNALAATFGSAAVSVITNLDTLSPYFAVAGIIPIFLFGFLDARYLRLEKAYRELYDHVRKGEEIEAYSLVVTPFMKGTVSSLSLVFSWSVGLFYGAICFSLIMVVLLRFFGA